MPPSAQLALFVVGAASFTIAVKRDLSNSTAPQPDGPSWLSGFCMGIALATWGALLWGKLLEW
jgi:hypothetical protein